jgi:hypothetical protein
MSINLVIKSTWSFFNKQTEAEGSFSKAAESTAETSRSMVSKQESQVIKKIIFKFNSYKIISMKHVPWYP